MSCDFRLLPGCRVFYFRLRGVMRLSIESHQGSSSHQYSIDTQQRPCAELGFWLAAAGYYA